MPLSEKAKTIMFRTIRSNQWYVLNPRVKDRIRAEGVAAFITEESKQRGINVIGSWGEPMEKRAAVQGRPFALVRAYTQLKRIAPQEA